MTRTYDRIGNDYARYRQADPRLAAAIVRALGPAGTLLNVGAGTGSYEPTDRLVVAVEPSRTMLRQRAAGRAPAIQASVDCLPFASGSFAAALAVLTIHHWPDRARGLDELRRVTRGRMVIVTWDPDAAGFWLADDYFPDLLAIDRQIFPTLTELRQTLGPIAVHPLPIPQDCSDGFLGAYWRRPAAYLETGVRGAISTFARLGETKERLGQLRRDLESGTWERRHGRLTGLTELDLGYRIVIAGDAGAATDAGPPR